MEMDEVPEWVVNSSETLEAINGSKVEHELASGNYGRGSRARKVINIYVHMMIIKYIKYII